MILFVIFLDSHKNAPCDTNLSFFLNKFKYIYLKHIEAGFGLGFIIYFKSSEK